MEIAKRITLLRKELGLTQKEFAKRLNIKNTYISKYESKLIKPSFDVLSNIGKAFNVNLNWLLTGEGEMFVHRASDGASAVYHEQELEAEIRALKKNISQLEKENKELNNELLNRMRKLLNLQDKLLSKS